MLNSIWLALIVIGIITAAGRDIYDASNDAYANGVQWQPAGLDHVGAKGKFTASVLFPAGQLRANLKSWSWPDEGVTLSATVIAQSASRATVVLTIGKDSPEMFRTMMETQGGKETVTATATRTAAGWTLTFEPVKFVFLKRITTAAFDVAGLAVQIAIGLIGIMALWLGVMKVAEEAGLIALLAKAVKPVTVRLFPDVPHDHPAIGSILMNVSANMLGLGNAATPFGLKAMEELNKLNPKAGVATNAMCTFLAMNTSCVTLIPATAIAIRAAQGSANPAIIIGTTFLASLTAMIVGVATAKILQRVRMFRWETSEAR